MKKSIILFSCFLFVITCFCGCGVDTANTNNKRYEIRTIDNEQYLVIDESVIESIESKIDVEMIQEAEIQFDSIDEFVNTVRSFLSFKNLANSNVVVPMSMMMLSPSFTISAAFFPIRYFSL